MSQQNEFCNWKCKLIIIGDASTGKTCLMRRYTDNEFSFNYASTIGVDFRTRMVSVGGFIVKVQIWDTAGGERNNGLVPIYYRNTNGALVVYDITNRNSFLNVERWITSLKKFAGNSTRCMLIGNKSDLEEMREVQTSEGEKLAGEHGMVFTETSAKLGENVDKTFIDIISVLTEEHTKILINSDVEDFVTIDAEKQVKDRCC